MGEKRKRLALSCVDCRRRKVKCDRTSPVCLRCQKSGNADNCTYMSQPGLESSLPTPSEDSPRQHHVPRPQVAVSGEPYAVAALREISPHLEVQSKQIPAASHSSLSVANDGIMRTLFGRAAQLETFTRTAGSKPIHQPFFAGSYEATKSDSNEATNLSSDFSKVLVRGKAFSTHYYGPSFAISMLLQFEELSKFVKGMVNEVPSLAVLKEKMAATRAFSKQNKRKAPPDIDSNSMIDMVPERAVADVLVNQYLATIETSYRILHVQMFKKDYEAFWQDPTAAKLEVVVILLLVMACMFTIIPDGPPGFVGRSSARREVATRWINACESWLEEQSQKHVTLAHFQVHTLIFLAKAILCIKIKREWTASGRLLRFAMAVGMHREPSLLSKRIGVFEQEMRRRLWYTIVELDLLTTIARGMPPTIDSFGWDCLPPRNIDDEDFNDSTQEMPLSKPRSVFTRTSFLHLTTETLPLRVEVLSRINSIRLGLDVEGAMQYDSKLRNVLDNLPLWNNDVSASFAQKLLTLSLYDFILILHIPFASQTNIKAASFYSISSKRDISFKTLQLYTEMSPLEKLLFTDIREDACRAVLALAHDVLTNLKGDTTLNHERVLALVENIVDACGTRFSTLGQGFHAYWITLSSFYLLKSRISAPQPDQTFAQEAANRVINGFEKVISHQVSMPLPNGNIHVENTQDFGNSFTADDSLEAFALTGSAFDQLNFFEDPFSDLNFDLPNMWSLDAYNSL